MRGSVLITFDELVDDRGFDAVVIRINNEIRKVIPNDTINQYTTYVNTSDVINVQVSTIETQLYETITVKRVDYTTDDTNGNFGIYETFITSGTSFNQQISVTATTRPDAYAFHYVVDCTTTIPCYNLGSGYTDTFFTNPAVRDVKIKNDLIYVVGNFNRYKGIPQSGLTVTNLDGSLFSGFTNLGCNTQGVQPRTVEVLSDGKIYVTTSNYGGVATNGLVRINTNGTRDTSFSGLTQITAGSQFGDIEIQSDGKIVGGGSFITINGTSRQGICRLNTNGSLDTSFGGVSGFTAPLSFGFVADIVDLAIQSDGKILCIGYFNAYSGTPINNLCRLNTDGTLDNTFTSPFVNFNNFQNLVVEAQPDGKILIGGSLRLVTGGTIYNVLRLNSNGTLDNTFTPVTGYGQCNDLELQSDGKIFVSTVGGTSVTNQFFRLNTNGTIDNTFPQIPFTDNNLLTSEVIALNESLNTFYLGGGFEDVDGTPYNRFVTGFISSGDLNMCS